MKKILFLILLLSSCAVYSYGLYEEFPVESKNLEGRSYPQNDLYRYSGTGKKRMPLGDAVLAMLNLKQVYFTSNTFVDVQACLIKKKRCKKSIVNYQNPKFSGIQSSRRSYLISQIEKAKSKNGGKFSDWTEAGIAAQKIVDKYYEWLGHNNIYRDFVKFRSTINGTDVTVANPNGIAWPSEVIYSSTLSWVSGLYGARTVIIKEKNPRSLDLGYWNFLNSGYWYGTARDMGEFIAAGYIPREDIVGYQVRHVTGGSFKPSKSKIGKRWQPEWHAIDFAFYLEETKDGPVVLILRGEEGNGCIERKGRFKYVFCYDKTQSLIKPGKLKKARGNPEKLARLSKLIRKDPTSFPSSSGRRPSILGIFKIKGNNTPKEYRTYSRKGRLTPKELKWFNKKVLKLNSNIEIVQ